jgi:uncharacterized protein YigA (DUF484 family)
MSEKDERFKLLNHMVEQLKKIEGEQQTTIEHLAKMQIEMQEAGNETVSSKLGQVFENASKNTDLIHEMIDEFSMEINQLKQSM